MNCPMWLILKFKTALRVYNPFHSCLEKNQSRVITSFFRFFVKFWRKYFKTLEKFKYLYVIHYELQNSFKKYISSYMCQMKKCLSVNSVLIFEVASFSPITLLFLSISNDNIKKKHHKSYDCPMWSFWNANLFLEGHYPFLINLRKNELVSVKS